MEKLYVLYDPKCELCRRLKDWLLIQRSWLGLCMVPAGSEKAKTMFPALQQIASANDLVVISDDGQVYMNNNAWIMALYALEEYRDWAYRLAHPLLAPLARQAFATISRNRYAISRWLRAGRPEEIANELRHVALEPCAAPHPTISDYLR
ncbi:MAG TPA: DCC1-like thiol-disulfide oxidoreductase family protein [Candidatus Angelobacter sp.]